MIVERAILGNAPLFRVPAYHLVHPAELIGYAALGIVGGLVSLVFCKSLLGLRAVFLSMPKSTRWFQPAIGGVVIGLILLVSPAVMGVGYEYVDQALNGGLVFKTLLLLCLLKLVATVSRTPPATPAASSRRASISVRWRVAPSAVWSTGSRRFRPEIRARMHSSAWGRSLPESCALR